MSVYSTQLVRICAVMARYKRITERAAQPPLSHSLCDASYPAEGRIAKDWERGRGYDHLPDWKILMGFKFINFI